MRAMASQITGVSILYLTLFLPQIEETSKLCLTGLCEGIQMFPFDDVIMMPRKFYDLNQKNNIKYIEITPKRV